MRFIFWFSTFFCFFAASVTGQISLIKSKKMLISNQIAECRQWAFPFMGNVGDN